MAEIHPYIVGPALAKNILESALASVASESSWKAARVYSDEDGRLREVADEKVRDAQVLPRANAPGVLNAYEEFIQLMVLPLANRRWGLQVDTLEGTQLIRYKKGGHFVPHTDSGVHFPTRCLTFLSYLNADFEGGATAFPAFDIQVKPEPGKTIAFLADCLHAGLPVLRGEKYLLATWAVCPPAPNWI